MKPFTKPINGRYINRVTSCLDNDQYLLLLRAAEVKEMRLSEFMRVALERYSDTVLALHSTEPHDELHVG